MGGPVPRGLGPRGRGGGPELRADVCHADPEGQDRRRDAWALQEACLLGAYRPAHRLSDAQRHVRGRLAVRDALVRTRTGYIALTRASPRQHGWRVPTGSAETVSRRVMALALPGRLLLEVAPLLDASALATSLSVRRGWLDTLRGSHRLTAPRSGPRLIRKGATACRSISTCTTRSPGLTGDGVKGAHQKDLEVQHKHGVQLPPVLVRRGHRQGPLPGRGAEHGSRACGPPRGPRPGCRRDHRGEGRRLIPGA